jgi:acyl-coenzyme A synthetase/AMP-(fatty) acid ligase
VDTLNHDRLNAAFTWLGRRVPMRHQDRSHGWMSRWPALAATLFAAAMLIAYVRVVLASVETGATRHRAVAAHADRVWRCNLLPLATQRVRCRAELDP